MYEIWWPGVAVLACLVILGVLIGSSCHPEGRTISGQDSALYEIEMPHAWCYKGNFQPQVACVAKEAR